MNPPRRSTRLRKDVSYLDPHVNEKSRDGYDQTARRRDVALLAGRGWTARDARRALLRHNGDVTKARAWLRATRPRGDRREGRRRGAARVDVAAEGAAREAAAEDGGATAAAAAVCESPVVRFAELADLLQSGTSSDLSFSVRRRLCFS